jgi:hypothetical protein
MCIIQEEMTQILGQTAKAAQYIFTKKLLKIPMTQGM